MKKQVLREVLYIVSMYLESIHLESIHVESLHLESIHLESAREMASRGGWHGGFTKGFTKGFTGRAHAQDVLFAPQDDSFTSQGVRGPKGPFAQPPRFRVEASHLIDHYQHSDYPGGGEGGDDFRAWEAQKEAELQSFRASELQRFRAWEEAQAAGEGGSASSWGPMRPEDKSSGKRKGDCGQEGGGGEAKS